MSDNRNLITNEIEELAKAIKKVDEKILKEAEKLKQGNVSPKILEKILSYGNELEKLLHTQTAFYAILGQWKEDK